MKAVVMFPHPGTVLSRFGDDLARDQDCGHRYDRIEDT